MSSIISLNNVHIQLKSDAGSVNILNGVSLDVPAGTTIGIVGPSGSGKTTLLMILSGLEKATTGSVRINDTDLAPMDEDQLATFRRDTIGVVFQNFHLIPTMTALENVAIPLELAGRKDAFAAARTALENVGLGHRITHYPGQLSGGEQQRVAIARAIVGNPKLILADEPTGNLDSGTGQKIIDLLFSIARESGATLVIVTHDMHLASLCERQIAISDGRITGQTGAAA